MQAWVIYGSSRRQIILDLAKLLIDDMEVVDQPFSRGRNRLFLLNRPSYDAVGIEEHAAVLEDTRNERAALACDGCDDLCCRKALGMLLESLEAEKFGADRFFQIRKEDVRRLILLHSRGSRFRGEKPLRCLVALLQKEKGPFHDKETGPHRTQRLAPESCSEAACELAAKGRASM